MKKITSVLLFFMAIFAFTPEVNAQCDSVDFNPEDCITTSTFTIPPNAGQNRAPGDKYYIISTTGNPWNNTTNNAAMDAAFGGGGWILAQFETLNPVDVFDAGTNFVFIEGGDDLTNEMNAFLIANLPTIEAWVNAGGILLLNAAPNEGPATINFGFGGTTLVNSVFAGTVDVVGGSHPALDGPLLPTATTMTGNSYGHAVITGTGLTPVITESGVPGNVVLAEKPFGAGHVMFGGMTTTNFHNPDPQAENFRANLLNYLDDFSIVGTAPIISCPMSITVDNDADACGAIVNFTAASAIDLEDGPLTPVQVAGPPTGSFFPTGTTTITYEVTDSDNNTVSCSFDITVNDGQAPDAVCMDITVELDPVSGMVTISPMDVDGGSTDNCGIDSMSLDISSFDCDDLGDNVVTLTVTDAAGNSTDCTATVTVEDNTAPTIMCIGQPMTIVDFEGASPGSVIDGTADVVSVITVTDDQTITDLNVDLNITHTWVGDLVVTLESPAGTVVTLLDQPGAPDIGVDGCPGDDIAATFDDDAANPAENECGNLPAIGGLVSPTDMLSAFNGESTAGDWTLTVSDVFPAFDNGTLDSWGVEYSYEQSGAPLDVILDASGNATISVSSLLAVNDDNCGTTAIVGPTMGAAATGDNLGAPIADDLPPVNSVASIAESGTVGDEFSVSVNLDITHTWTGDLNIDLTSPAGTTLNLASGVGGSGDNFSGTVFEDGGMDITGGSAPFTGTWEPQGGTFADTFGGESITGDWTLTVTDGVGGDDGTLNDFAINFNPINSTEISFDCSQLGENLVEVTVIDTAGNMSSCTATVNVIDETAPIITCGPQDEAISVSDSPGTAIPDSDPAGVSTTISIAEDQELNDLTVDLNITHTWVGDLIVTLESPEGTVVTLVDRIGTTGGGFGCSDADLDVTIDDNAASPLEDACTGGGPITGTFTGIDALSAFNGENAQGDWILTVSDNAGGDTGNITSWGLNYLTPPTVAEVIIELDENGMAEIDAFDIISSVDEACGISTSAVDIDEFTCADIGTPIIVTAFVSDASGNIAACQATVLVVDNLAPVLTCPEDQTVDPGPNELFYMVPDYFANGEATVSDNCTDPITITTQDPAPGTELPDGVYTVTLTAEDEYGNVATCSFELTVESILGTDNTPFDVGVSVYPNPAVNNITIDNRTGINLESVMIFDMNGRAVINQSLDNMAQGQKTVDVSALATGVYMVQIQGDDQTTVKRLIKQ